MKTTITDSIGLMIKACAQDGEYIDRLLRHILKMLRFKDFSFNEIVVVVDCKRDSFLRQYSKANFDRLEKVLNQFQNKKFIHRWVIAPTSQEKIRHLNHQWFNCRCSDSHSKDGVPVFAQLWGFEQMKTDYILQCDADIIVRRRDWNHNFVSDMYHTLKSNETVLSVGSNIPHRHTSYVPYTSKHKGEYVPEVRFCLIKKSRLLSRLPFPNKLIDNQLSLTWYRSIEEFQRRSVDCSPRGGDGRSFYLHPMNTLKNKPYFWMQVIEKVEKGILPEEQYEHYDVIENERIWEKADTDNFEQHIFSPEQLHTQMDKINIKGKILFVRHGGKKKMSKFSPLEFANVNPLSKEGKKGVTDFTKKLKYQPKLIFCSNLLRCLQTARAIRALFPTPIKILVIEELLGGKFMDYSRWLDLKRELGWSEHIWRWIHGKIEAGIIEPYEVGIKNLLHALKQRLPSEDAFVIVITQGHVNTALNFYFNGVVEFRGGPLYGFFQETSKL